MNQPLGRMAGNTVEIEETLATLAGRGPADLVEVTLALGAELLVSTHRASDANDARLVLQRHIDSGDALVKFAEMVVAQGGSLDFPRPIAPASILVSPRAGWLSRIQTEQLGWAVIAMGGGRHTLSDLIDHSVGLEMLVRLGDQVDQGQPLIRLYAGPEASERAGNQLATAFEIHDAPIRPPELIVERITE